ncbi:site-specific integrase [Plebeiibacterium sediminum]|uniref:Site-specific integrase n=1 Tax=Plebeiibacterium sediminum TaxID=2992112 RepID=A0AAE3M2C8_9BACT|nr:site-specific integrase [Plebeiobacterium sediminum]MCW3785484.1 site-specific integrase [Plebeiobacterium sediminum]
MIGATTAIVHDTRIKKKDGTYAIKLRVTYNREQKYFPVGKFLTKDDWKTMKEGKHRNKTLKDLETHLSGIENKAIKIIDNMESFSFAEFMNQFNDKPQSKTSVLDALSERHKELTDKDRISTAITFQYTIKSIEDYLTSIKRKKLSFTDITPEWLQSFEDWMTSKGKSITTTGMFLRNLRTMVNQAIEEGNLPRENYPFSKNKYQIPSARNVKKALTIENIKQFIEYPAKTEAEQRAKDMWLFSYLCNGVNMKDIVRLKFKNMDSKRISFVRSKTERSTKANQKSITAIRIPEINAIIEKWGNKHAVPNNYVFPILSVDDTPEEEYEKIKQAVKTINKYTKRIGKELNFELSLTTYTARHSFATVLKRSGAPIEFISESLGHNNLRTTESYLDSFEDDTKESYQRKLLDF